jgi:pimeloyl-ACP methyl ester carboxylesterase
MATVTLPSGLKLSYQEWGRPDGAVVLMLHGLGSSSASWRNVGPAIGDRFRVIAPDARGHGGSDWAKDYSFEAMRDDVVQLMDRLGILGAILVGHSMGALTAYELAATRPEMVRLLVLEEMPPPAAATPPLEIPRRPDPGADHDWRAVIAVRRWRNAPPPAWWAMAARITSKTLVIGARGSHLPLHRMEEVSRRIPHAEYASVEGGHSFHQQRPSILLRLLEPFIAYFAK